MNLENFMTNIKYGRPVLEASGNSTSYDKMAVDAPFVFWHGGRYYMLHVGYDGKGYQSALAVSYDLLHWKKETVLFPRGSRQGWDKVGVAGMWILKNDNLHGMPTLKKIDGKYWMIYHSYPDEGYEQGPAKIGLAYTEDEALHNWKCLDQPILSWEDGAAWERGGLYKGCLIERENKYFLFYNAKDSDNWLWHEQIGAAVSDDLIHWERISDEPVIKNTQGAWDSHFCADPCVVWDGSQWVMFYYGYDGMHAQEGIAFSTDLIHWSKADRPILRHGAEGDVDEIHAHKPCVIERNGVLYHFYCAVRPIRDNDQAINEDPTRLTETDRKEFRCITVAVNQPDVFSKVE